MIRRRLTHAAGVRIFRTRFHARVPAPQSMPAQQLQCGSRPCAARVCCRVKMLCQLSSPCGLSQQAASRPSVYAAWPSQEHRDMCLNSPQLQDICYPPGKPYHWLRKHNSIWQVAHAAMKPPAHHDGCRLRRALPQPSGPRGGRHAASSPAAMTDSNGDHTTACPTVRLQSSTRPIESHPLRTGPESFPALHLSLGQSMASTGSLRGPLGVRPGM